MRVVKKAEDREMVYTILSLSLFGAAYAFLISVALF
jgi:hypothetical protein